MSFSTLEVMHAHHTHDHVRANNRDASLDGLRALAILRVITWHATGWAWTTWIVSSVPAMFAVSGALLAKSFEKNGIRSSLQKRFTRLFPPLWIYCGLVYVLSWHAHVLTSPAWTFVVPLDQPTSPLATQWLTSALWYLRAYVWVLILSPILFYGVKKFGAMIPALGAMSVFVLGWRSLDHSGLSWAIGDVVLYSTYAAAGMMWLSGDRVSRRTLMPLAAIAFAFTCVWNAVRPTTSNVVNNDHILHLLVGGFWIATLLCVPSLLSRFATTRIAQFLNAYPLSVYLWHSLIAWSMWQLLPQWYPTSLRGISVVIFTIALLPCVAYLVGFFERNPWQFPPLRVLVTRSIAATLLLVAFSVPAVKARINFVRSTINQPLPPSAAPKITKLRLDPSVQKFVNSAAFKSTTWSQKETKLQQILERYDSQMKLDGTRAIVISSDGDIWHGLTEEAKPFNEPSLIGSLTKTFTTSLIMRLVEQGTLSFDGAIGDLGIGFSHKEVTVHQLLTQSSGMPRFSTQSGSVPKGTSVSQVLQYISAQPLRFRPGTEIEYSTTGFAVLGALLEQKTGKSFDSLVKSELARPLGYDISTFIGDFGSIGFSTGGISMTMDDLADWAHRYFYEQSTTSKKWSWSIKQTTGVGTHGYCPCENGDFMALGHIGGRTFASVDGDGTVVIIDTKGVLVNENYETTQAMAQELRLVAGGGKNPLYRK